MSDDDLNLPNKITVEYIEKLIEAFKAQQSLSIEQVKEILNRVLDIFKQLPNCLDFYVKTEKRMTVVGDTHGQFFDVLNLFSVNGLPSNQNSYLFNGDFVDRGSFGCETILTLLCYKIYNFECVHLLRGNHESKMCTTQYGFKAEVVDKYNEEVYEIFLKVFQALPICAVVNKKIFIVHGGLFTRPTVTLDEIQKLNRFVEPEEEKGEELLAQMLWSDPTEHKGIHTTLRPHGCHFGPDVTRTFLLVNRLSMIIRSHELRQTGFAYEHDGQLITVFSAPCYNGVETNYGAYVHLVGRSRKGLGKGLGQGKDVGTKTRAHTHTQTQTPMDGAGEKAEGSEDKGGIDTTNTATDAEGEAEAEAEADVDADVDVDVECFQFEAAPDAAPSTKKYYSTQPACAVM